MSFAREGGKEVGMDGGEQETFLKEKQKPDSLV